MRRILFLAMVISSFQPAPAMSTKIHLDVNAGETVASFCRKFQDPAVNLCVIIEDIAGENDFEEFSFIPPRQRSLSRFEGLIRPGRYTLWILNTDDPRPDVEQWLYHMLANTSNYLKRHEIFSGLSLRDSMILASIVQKEAVLSGEYRKIASVFLNRLRVNMPLSSCPSVEYALGYHRPFLSYWDIMIDSPYNVYLYRGLPPAPISFFDEEAYLAVTNPVETNFFFFVYDWTKDTVSFAATEAEHNQNAHRARNNFIARYGYERMNRIDESKYYEN